VAVFKNFSDNISKIFDKLGRKGLLTEEDLNIAMREIRIALLEADVALSVVKDFIAKVKEKAVGEKIISSIKPSQMVVKIVNDELTNLLGAEDKELQFASTAPTIIMMVGLQGSGKTTTSAKLALYLKKKYKKTPLLASLDIYRPAAQKQLEILAKQLSLDSLEIIEKQQPKEIAERAIKHAKANNQDLVILDTAGRLHIDQELMAELDIINNTTKPHEILLVVDSMTGQDAVNVASAFKEKLPLTGVILTRIDGDARGGAALSLRQVTGCPIKFLGTGEKLNELEEFHADRIASRILGMGDIVSLVEHAAEMVDKDEAEALAKKLKKTGSFDLDDLANQLRTLKKMGGVSKMLGMIPGLGKLQDKMPSEQETEKNLKVQMAILGSMTKKERKNPDLFNGSRKRRVALGAGVEVMEVNKLLKQFKEMNNMMKKFSRMDPKSMMRGGMKNLFS
jgi:signal recognition particle subunit SRP54